MYGLFFRGLGATVLREIPACTFYLVDFEVAKASLGALGCPPVVVAVLQLNFFEAQLVRIATSFCLLQ